MTIIPAGRSLVTPAARTSEEDRWGVQAFRLGPREICTAPPKERSKSTACTRVAFHRACQGPLGAHQRSPESMARGTVLRMTFTMLLTSFVWLWPVVGPVVTPFQAPEHTFGPGHRGIDIAGEEGDPVRAAHAGRISFAGLVAGVPTITIRNGPVATSYQPVHASLAVDAEVRAGDVVGRLGAHHGACTCLHLGVRVDGRYRDPLDFLRPRVVVKSPRAP